MKTINIENINIAYKKCGKGSRVVLLLHGWGVDHQLMEPLAEHLQQFFTVYYFDWPGFGVSDLPPYAFSTDDYCRILAGFVQEMKIKDPLIIAHSFGGGIALRYAAVYPVSKMVLTGAAGLRPPRTLSYYLKVYTYKALKQIRKIPGLANFAGQQQFGSADYLASQGVMRTTFVKVVNDDVSHLLEKIETEVLLVYGENDEDTPLWMGEYLAKHLKNAGLAVFANDDHYAYLHQLKRFLKVVDIFWKEEENA